MLTSLWMFMFFYLVSFLVVFSFSDWFMMWVGLEINMMSFISFMLVSKSKMEVEGLYKYFFIQGVGSCLVMFGMMEGEMMEVALSLKMGAGPFYFWYPEVVEKVEWWGSYLLMSFQKLLPLLLLSSVGGIIYVIMGIISMMVGSLGSFGVMSVSKLLAFSSILNLGWMMVSLVLSNLLWMEYFLIYSFVLVSVVLYLSNKGIEKISEMGILSKGKIIFYVLVLGGVPPMAGFMMKWLILVEMMKFSIFLSVVMVFSSLVLFYIYFRMIFGILMGLKVLSLFKFEKEEVNLMVLLDFFMVIGMVGGIFLFESL